MFSISRSMAQSWWNARWRFIREVGYLRTRSRSFGPFAYTFLMRMTIKRCQAKKKSSLSWTQRPNKFGYPGIFSLSSLSCLTLPFFLTLLYQSFTVISMCSLKKSGNTSLTISIKLLKLNSSYLVIFVVYPPSTTHNQVG